MTIKCAFCGSDAEFLYKLDKYEIYQCKHCKTAFTKNMPTEEELKEYYDGFNFCVYPQNKYKICSKAFQDWYKDFNFPQNAKMLDIGGGGGYFSLAFEKYGFGEATYIDLDSQACEYAKDLGLNKVINDSVLNLKNITNEKYNFIYCRHVIEHLTDPTTLVNYAIDLLNDGGLFILQFPNGLSIERLCEDKFREHRIDSICKSNDFSRCKALKLLYSDKTCSDLEPPRHLWAISKQGITEFLSKRKDIEFKLETKSIEDRIWSPYYHHPRNHIKFIRLLHELYSGGNHLICKIRKK